LNELFTLFFNILLPIFLIAGTGMLLARATNLDPRSLSQVIFYIFSPCLIFTLLTQSKLERDMIGRIILYAVFSCLLIGILTWIIGKMLKMDGALFAGVLITSMFMNSGNYGLPVVLFAFGPSALGYASLFFVINVGLTYTLGTMIASMSSMSLSKAFLNLFKLPMIYAMLLAMLFLFTGWNIPLPIERTTKLLGDAAIPCMLVLLGMQLKSASFIGRIKPIALTSTMRLLVSPVLAILFLPLFGLTGSAQQAITVQAGMPAAVLTTMLATEFNSEPAFVTVAVFVSTLLSPLTLTPLLAFLGV
jgi:malate permease and related proteins